MCDTPPRSERCLGVSATASRYHVTSYDGLDYSVDLTENVLALENPLLGGYCRDRQVMAFVSPTVDRLYGHRLRAYLDAWLQPQQWTVAVLPSGELNKTLSGATRVWELLRRHRLDRHGLLLAVGGGVICDLVGFAASVYARGMDHIKVNTTLVGQVDVGVGVKTGVNFGETKNLLGAFHPAHASINDRTFLRTLDTRELRCGLAEIIKMAIIRDHQLFETIEGYHLALLGRQPGVVADEIERYVVDTSMRLMLEELWPNLRERRLERLVDFGHTFSPAIEVASGYTVRHGEAVAVDMALSTRIAVLLGLLDEESCQRILTLLRRVGLPIFHQQTCTPAQMHRALRDAFERRARQINLVVPIAVGAATFVHKPADLPDRILDQALADLVSGHRSSRARCP
jgi:3-dehydroquinate synthetase